MNHNGGADHPSTILHDPNAHPWAGWHGIRQPGAIVPNGKGTAVVTRSRFKPDFDPSGSPVPDGDYDGLLRNVVKVVRGAVIVQDDG